MTFKLRFCQTGILPNWSVMVHSADFKSVGDESCSSSILPVGRRFKTSRVRVVKVQIFNFSKKIQRENAKKRRNVGKFLENFRSWIFTPVKRAHVIEEKIVCEARFWHKNFKILRLRFLIKKFKFCTKMTQLFEFWIFNDQRV